MTRNSVADIFGDKVMAAHLPGDSWRERHDKVKTAIHQLCAWSGVSTEVEVFNLFSPLIPQEGLNRMERGRKRQGLSLISRWCCLVSGRVEWKD